MHFNPRTPCGVRPRAAIARTPSKVFQSTHPLRGATCATSFCVRRSIFQSTHPLRGATRFGDSVVRIYTISIHAPLAGCDLIKGQLKQLSDNFNPRTPCGVRQVPVKPKSSAKTFQSTHPLRGATISHVFPFPRRPISIHAPLAGCDPKVFDLTVLRFNFNPRTPCGVRLITITPQQTYAEFQSTHPLRGATGRPYFFQPLFKISIHAPLAGCDPLYYLVTRPDLISIHAPLAGCDVKQREDYQGQVISIHAPLAGCDGAKSLSPEQRFKFQSTHPLRGATLLTDLYRTHTVISIHAPLAGCDILLLLQDIHAIISIHAPLAGCDALLFPEFI